MWLSNVNLEAVISSNGDMAVSETWEVQTNSEEGYRNLYRTINTYDSAFDYLSKITLLGVVNKDTGENYPIEKSIERMNSDNLYSYYVETYNNVSYICQSSGALYEIGVIISPIHKGDTVTLTFSYIIEDFIRGYKDTAEFWWKPYFSFSMHIKELEIKVVMPTEINFYDIDNSFVWLQIDNISNQKFENNEFIVKANNIKPTSSVEIHSLVSVDAFSELSKNSSEAKKEFIISNEGQ